MIYWTAASDNDTSMRSEVRESPHRMMVEETADSNTVGTVLPGMRASICKDRREETGSSRIIGVRSAKTRSESSSGAKILGYMKENAVRWGERKGRKIGRGEASHVHLNYRSPGQIIPFGELSDIVWSSASEVMSSACMSS